MCEQTGNPPPPPPPPPPPAASGTSGKSDITKELLKFGVLTVLQLLVLLSAVYIVVNPVVSMINSKSAEQMQKQAEIKYAQKLLDDALLSQQATANSLASNFAVLDAKIQSLTKEIDVVVDPAKRNQAKELLAAVSKMLADNKNAVSLLTDVQALNKRFQSGSTNVQHGATRIDVGNHVNGVMWFVRIYGEQYDYRYFLIVAHDGYGGTDLVQEFPIKKFPTGSPYGKPTFEVDKADSSFRVVNTNWPTGSLTLNWTRIDPN